VPSGLRLATRGSPLARRQSELVANRLRSIDIAVELVIVETLGDAKRDVPMSELAGQGVFTTEVDRAVLEDRADVAVHSAKDLPSSATAAGLTIAAVPERADPRDAVVVSNFRMPDLTSRFVTFAGISGRDSSGFHRTDRW
jgi:hydroxymethylbilane synthase